MVRLPGRINPVFMNMLRGYVWELPQPDLASFRRAYHASSSSAIRPRSHIMESTDSCCKVWESSPGARVIGVHKRLGTPEVAACQLSQRAPEPKEFIDKVRVLL